MTEQINANETIRMTASLIWYRARPGGSLSARLGELLSTLEAKALSDEATIEPAAVPALLVQALRSSDITVIIGGMDVRREDDNIVYILARCLTQKLEAGNHSRSKYIFDTLRGTRLPTFEKAVLFPSAAGGPEGMLLTSGGRAILLLPWMESRQFDIIEMMKAHLPSLLGLEPEEDIAESEANIAEEVSAEPALPAYIEHAAAKHRAAAIRPDEEMSAAQLRARLADSQEYFNPTETNRQSAQIPGAPRPSGYRPPVRTAQPPAAPSRQAIPYPPAALQEQPNRKATVFFRTLSVLVLLVVIIGTCIIAFNHYEPGLLDDSAPYQSELAALYTEGAENADPAILPQFALPQFAALYSMNREVRGFIDIPGTEISLPIMQASDGDRGRYQNVSFYGTADERGSLYFDDTNNIVFGADNSHLIVYGSSPADGTLFAPLKNYTSADYLARHQIIRLDTLYEQSEWIIFSVCLVSSNTVSDFNYMNTAFSGQNAREQHLQNLYVRSLFYTKTQVFPSDDLLTLVTDSDEFTGARLLVCARRIRPDEDISDSQGGILVNELALMPDVWYELHGQQAPSAILGDTSTMREPLTVYNVTDENGNKVYVYDSTVAGVTTTTIPTSSASGADGEDTTSAPTTAATAPEASGTLPAMRITSGGKVITGDAAEVLAMIIEAEMGSDFHIEALKAQAVASYTYYLYSGGSAKAPSFPTKTAGERALEAARAVAGQYMTCNGVTPYTPYFAISAGYTANNADINETPLSYLVSVDCSVDQTLSDYRDVREVPAAEVASKVYDKKGIDLNLIANKNEWFEILERDENGLYVTKVSVGGTTFRGNTLHLSILGYTCLRSPCFDIEYNAENDKFIFTSLGYGSGVGMSQSGANEYAKQGHDYLWILKYFYTGVDFSTV